MSQVVSPPYEVDTHLWDDPTCPLETNVQLAHPRLNQKAPAARKQKKQKIETGLNGQMSAMETWNQKVPVMTGAMGSGIDRTDVNELSFHMEMVKAEMRKRSLEVENLLV